jgi:DNA modification methylase
MRAKFNREPSWDEVISEAKKKGLYIYEGASIFDPVLCEICYTWFTPKQGKIMDPFAGGSVRGIVANILGYEYCGIDLRKDQVEANYRQAEKLCKGTNTPVWITGDSNQVLDELKSHQEVDFVFSCPPYHDLEQYSDLSEDLSNMDYDHFLQVYKSIIHKSLARLKNNRFACFVVGDIRDKSGFYRNFVSDTIDSFCSYNNGSDSKVFLYNEIILVNVAGSLPVRINKQFGNYRKVGKMHQNVLVFYKGDPKKIKEEFPEIDCSDIEI